MESGITAEVKFDSAVKIMKQFCFYFSCILKQRKNIGTGRVVMVRVMF
jgi:hypothetical protein